jgi:hypothetical protein
MNKLPENRQITCRDTTVMVSAARDGELDAAGHAALLQHIASCPYCKDASKQFDALFKNLDQLLARNLPE